MHIRVYIVVEETGEVVIKITKDYLVHINWQLLNIVEVTRGEETIITNYQGLPNTHQVTATECICGKRK